MHELSVVKGIIKTVTSEARKKKIHKISGINIVVGDLSSMIDDSLKYYFELLSHNPVLKRSKLHISRTQAIMVCNTCQAKIPASLPLPSACVKCKSMDIHVNGGMEFYIDSIEVQDENIS